MMRSTLLLMSAAFVALAPTVVGAESFVIPFVAHNARGQDETLWSSEIYLTNLGAQPVQVSLIDFLPGALERSRPCDRPTAPTRVVPPLSSVVWTASGLATDLGCADRAIGSLVLSADGPIHVVSRTVNHPAGTDHARRGLLAGPGQEVEAISVDQLPGPGESLLPALIWHRNTCGPREFDTYLGFANPGDVPVVAVLDVPPAAADGGVLVDDVEVELPHAIRVPARSWLQIHLEPKDDPTVRCLGPASFAATVTTDGPLAMYGSVVSRGSSDPRTVLPVPLD
jgi:hypothetical protein